MSRRRCTTRTTTTPKLLLGVLFLLILNFTATAQTQVEVGFKCNSTSSSSSSSSPATCKALVGYVSPNATTLSNIATLFGLTDDDLHSLLGANSLSEAEPVAAVAANQTIKIPITCGCINGRGTSNKGPIYKVKAGDSLDHIARNIFSLLVTYQQIAQANRIPDPNKILVGQNVTIPLPCSCDAVDGVQVVHYAHVVKPDSTVEMIAREFGTTPETLLKLNGLAANSKALKAETVIDVPLKACTSIVSNTSPDYPLLVSDGTYAYTANNCVRCMCDSSRNNGELLCQKPSPDIKPLRWAQCPPTLCPAKIGPDLGLGGTSSTSLSGSCKSTTCAYTGYNSTAISTAFTPEFPCPAGTLLPNNGGTNIGLQRSKLLWLLSFALPILSALLC